MFCSNCGCELSEGAHFCSKCGEKIITSDVATVKEKQFEKNAPVSAEFENITVQNQFSERVNSELFADRWSQNQLFSVYADLIAPVKRIEELTEQVAMHEQQIAYLKNVYSAEMQNKRLLTIIAFIVFSVMFKIDGSPVAIVAEMTMPGIVKPILDWSWELEFFPASLAVALLAGVFAIFAIPVLFTIIFMIVLNFVIAPMIRKKNYKRNLAEAEKIERVRDDLLKERDKLCYSEKDKLMYVPKKYRYSEALEYFVDLYNSTRVDTLKEAVNTYVHDKQEEEKRKLIEEKLNQVIRYLSSVEESLEYMR